MLWGCPGGAFHAAAGRPGGDPEVSFDVAGEVGRLDPGSCPGKTDGSDEQAKDRFLVSKNALDG